MKFLLEMFAGNMAYKLNECYVKISLLKFKLLLN